MSNYSRKVLTRTINDETLLRIFLFTTKQMTYIETYKRKYGTLQGYCLVMLMFATVYTHGNGCKNVNGDSVSPGVR